MPWKLPGWEDIILKLENTWTVTKQRVNYFLSCKKELVVVVLDY